MKIVYRFAWSVLRFVVVPVLGVRYVAPERIPRTGRLILAGNHRTYLDPPLVGCGVDRECYYFAKAELFSVPLLGRLIRSYNAFPVRRGQADRRSVAQAIACVRAGGALVMFPEGTRARTAEFLPPKTGVGLIGRKTGAPVYPVYVGSGGWRTMIRSALRIERMVVAYGEPVDPSAFQGSDEAVLHAEIARVVMERIEGLRARSAGRDPRSSAAREAAGWGSVPGLRGA